MSDAESDLSHLTGGSEVFTNFSFDVKDTPIWRYTSLAKFVNVLRAGSSEMGELVFLRADIFEDEYEGTLPQENREFKRSLWENTISDIARINVNLKDEGSKVVENPSEEDIDLLMKADQEFRERMRKVTYMNCWRRDEYESSSMWEAYTTRSDGIAIKSTISDLVNSFENWSGRVFVSDVEYKDFESVETEFPEGFIDLTSLSPYFLKREEFKDEREIRAVITDYDHPKMYPGPRESMPSPGKETRAAAVDLSQLINSVVVHPDSKPYLKKTVRHILKNHGLDPELVTESSLR